MSLSVVDASKAHRYRYRCDLCAFDLPLNAGKHLIHQHGYTPTAALEAVTRAIAALKAAGRA